MPINTFTVFGTAFVYVGNPLTLLGYTEQGVDIDLTESKDELMTDLLGSKTPQDFQDMGGMARIVAPLIALDTTVLDTIFMFGNRTATGMINTPGLVLGANGVSIPLAVRGGPLGELLYSRPWFFPYTIIRSHGSRVATKANPWRLEALAWPLKSFTASSGKDGVLFTRALP